MSAPKEKLGIIAGGGDLPARLVRSCEEQGIEVFIVAFEGQTDPALTEGREHLWSRLGAVGTIIQTLKNHDITDLVLIGSIRRPTLAELRPDMRTAAFFSRIAFKSLGDDDLLIAVRKELESEGFRIRGVHHYVQELLMPRGVLGSVKPNKQDEVQIQRGVSVTQVLGSLDVGQAAVVQEGIVLAVEGIEGTDALIQRCKHLLRKGRGPVLVKTCKPQQDKDFDLPTIGPDTVRNAYESGFQGIAVHAGNALLLDKEEVIELANRCKIFVVGVDI